MACDPSDLPLQDPDKLRKLAADIVESIIKDTMSGDTDSDAVVSARRVCPPNKLCCWAGYKCTAPFYCDEYFGCINRFSVTTGTLVG